MIFYEVNNDAHLYCCTEQYTTSRGEYPVRIGKYIKVVTFVFFFVYSGANFEPSIVQPLINKFSKWARNPYAIGVAAHREAGRGALATPSFIPATLFGRLWVFHFAHIIPFAVLATRSPTRPYLRLEVPSFACSTKNVTQGDTSRHSARCVGNEEAALFSFSG